MYAAKKNAEIRDNSIGYLEFNTAVEKDGTKGCLNISHWDNIPFNIESVTVTFQNEDIIISFKPQEILTR